MTNPISCITEDVGSVVERLGDFYSADETRLCLTPSTRS
jgi:hypothetical protein